MRILAPLVLALAALTSSCALHSTATHWNERVGPHGEPVYVKSTTKIGLNLFIGIKLLGATDSDGMVDEVTQEIARENGDRVRIIQSSTENYWYGFPPFTWILTPVISDVAAEYQPSEERLAQDQAEAAE